MRGKNVRDPNVAHLPAHLCCIGRHDSETVKSPDRISHFHIEGSDQHHLVPISRVKGMGRCLCYGRTIQKGDCFVPKCRARKSLVERCGCCRTGRPDPLRFWSWRKLDGIVSLGDQPEVLFAVLAFSGIVLTTGALVGADVGLLAGAEMASAFCGLPLASS